MPAESRPTAREAADLLRDLDRMAAAVGGWAHRIDPDALRSWEARKASLLTRCEEATLSH